MVLPLIFKSALNIQVGDAATKGSESARRYIRAERGGVQKAAQYC